jgi:hypothetical protein
VKALKSSVVLFLMCSFLSSTLGVNVYKHYCGDLLEGISVFIQSNPCADEGGEEACTAGKETDCCEDETEYYQLDIELVTQQVQQLSSKQFLAFTQLLYLYSPFGSNSPTSSEFGDEPPPQIRKDLYQKYEQLIFYG